jgi:hypothetical protein
LQRHAHDQPSPTFLDHIFNNIWTNYRYSINFAPIIQFVLSNPPLIAVSFPTPHLHGCSHSNEPVAVGGFPEDHYEDHYGIDDHHENHYGIE